ncbi:hypothetical protein ABFS82_14G255800 [Erythranthe guttata]|uniref:Fungal lipase-type domain-containing protein n=1 Tax=Erythranthe guttata TaxID=4155 RepID=A0A022RBL0_ERYGU|nr:hypothetical protein MIMGU_mgv1a005782mg [Erythranthe guttata]
MAGDEEAFCENYLLLKPEEASFFDFLRILFSSNLESKEFCNTGGQGGVITDFRHRSIVFVSVLLQKILFLFTKPLAAVGNLVELLLNYPSANGGFFRLLINLVTGKLVRPDRTSVKFTSFVGSIDKRIELDKSITRGSTKYSASLAIMASKLSYENQSFIQNVVTNYWKMQFLDFYNFWNDHLKINTIAIMIQDKTAEPNLIVVAFRGTEPFDAGAWRADVDISWYEFDGIGKIHGGFMKALGLQSSTGWPKELPAATGKTFAYYEIRQKLKTLIKENWDAKFVVTGHSLGGALAILFVTILIFHEEDTLLNHLEGVYTFGQPRVGNEQFGEWMKGKMSKYRVNYFRYVYTNDMVPRLPYDDKYFLYKHFGPCLYFNSCYKGQALEEEPNKNYFSLFYLLPKILIAVYELIRSFIIPWTRGRDYREGWLMKILRITGLTVPGLTEHLTMDYVNLTRLGKFIYPPNKNRKQI